MAENEVDYTKIEEHLLAGVCGDDAMKWSIAFVQIHEKNGSGPIDADLMLGWFANCIEAATVARTA